MDYVFALGGGLIASIRNIVGGTLPYWGGSRYPAVLPLAVSDHSTGISSLMSDCPRQDLSALWTKFQPVVAFPFRYVGRTFRTVLHAVGRIARKIAHTLAMVFFLILTLVFVCNVLVLIYGWATRYRIERDRIKRTLEDLEQQRLLQTETSGRRYQGADTGVAISNREGSEPTPSSQRLTASAGHVYSSSEVKLHEYIQYARRESLRLRGKPMLAQCWTTISHGLGDTQNFHVTGPYLTSSILEACLSSPNDNAVLFCLFNKAAQVGLQSVAQVYLKPLLYNFDN
jgi:hypothetical protein